MLEMERDPGFRLPLLDPLSAEITRRQMFLVLGGLLLAPTVAADTARDWYYDQKFSESLQQYPNARFYFHNAATNPDMLQKSLQTGAPNIEIDVLSIDGKLYAAHSEKELKIMSDDQKEDQRLANIITKIIDAGKCPAFDIKFGKDEPNVFEEFMRLVKVLVPKNRPATFSGKDFKVLGQIPSGEKRIVVYTVERGKEKEYFSLAKIWIDNGGKLGQGATINSDLATDRSPILEFNRENGLETNIWSVNNLSQVFDLLKRGATGITSDNAQMLNKLVHAS